MVSSMAVDAFHPSSVRLPRALPQSTTGRRLLMAVGVMAVLALEAAFIWRLGSTGDHFNPRCMQPEAMCSR